MVINKLFVWLCLWSLLSTSSLYYVYGKFTDDYISDRFYTKSALTFLREYGRHYQLFDAFYNDKPTKKNTSVRRYQLFDAFYNNKPTKKNGKRTIEESGFLVRNYSNFRSWNNAHSSDSLNPHNSSSDFFNSWPTMREVIKKYNDRFRFGPKIDDRFLSIGLDADPWNSTRNGDAINIHFIGVNVLPANGTESYVCVFTYPVHAQSRIFVEEPLPGRINVHCELPAQIIASIRNNKDILHIQFDFQQRSSHNSVAEQTLLSDISLYPTHSLERRSFRFTVQTMVSTISHPMLVEWLVYNILLGVEHFFIFLDCDISTEDILQSPIHPFIDANVVSIIYFPYYHPKDFNQVQEPALNTHLHIFSSRSEWVGYWDMDEFFLPSRALIDGYFSMVKKAHHATVFPSSSNSLLSYVVKHLDKENSSAIIFDSLEMGCDKIDPEKRYQAHSMNCLVVGQLFVERQVGHGKMLVRPDRIKYMASPHRLFEAPITWTDKESGGVFCHFNDFRYSRYSGVNISFSERDDLLRNTTKKLFEVMLRIDNL